MKPKIKLPTTCLVAIRKMVCLFLLSILTISSFSQDGTNQQSTSLMASQGKIYVVMTIVLVILVGFFIYLISLDRKIGKIEKEIKN
jgi:CcmD family protein